ncbi:hypothetical protein RFI_25226 [Reticulomyxa filosa]|uniref:Uncharacterized protein n=1 Tax=Reticulomyxa filosa TaxID=46433 RepID=X6ME18_RETFI|nr:hypothetical protein RFI_25226 [Reticulomyxa filosa]|eukprot:ETO12149.1 hypothetical protein RFI_25226 [Reticulomyxa filosa]
MGVYHYQCSWGYAELALGAVYGIIGIVSGVELIWMLFRFKEFRSVTKVGSEKKKNENKQNGEKRSSSTQNAFVSIFRTQRSQQWFLVIVCAQTCLRSALFFLLPKIGSRCDDVSPLHEDRWYYAILEIAAVFLFQFAFSCLAYQFLLFYYSIVVKIFLSPMKYQFYSQIKEGHKKALGLPSSLDKKIKYHTIVIYLLNIISSLVVISYFCVINSVKRYRQGDSDQLYVTHKSDTYTCTYMCMHVHVAQ